MGERQTDDLPCELLRMLLRTERTPRMQCCPLSTI
jgi:hypothetical protein